MTESQAISVLTRNGVGVDTENKVLYLKHQPGIGVWGVIDLMKTAYKYRINKGWEK